MTSPLQTLAQLREQAAAKQTLTLEVPRWHDAVGVKILVTYKPAEDSVVQKTLKVAASKNDDANKQANLQLHVDAASSITWILQDGSKAEYDGFKDTQLSEDLGVENKSARNTVDALFLTDGDMYALAGKVVEWSGYSNTEINQEALGE
jgi:hypothetical protein